jgi:hypothetical protein
MCRFVVMVLFIVVPAVATAEPEVAQRSDVAMRPRIAMSLGVGTPTGELGFEYTQVLFRYLEIGAGVGIGVTGFQGSVMPRLRIGGHGTLLMLGAGLSGGMYDEPQLFDLCLTTNYDECRNQNPKTTALWGNFELGIQRTTPTGFTWRFYGGVGEALGHGDCLRGNCDRVDGMTIPYLGFSIGHTL